MGADRVGEFVQAFLIKVLSRLPGIGDDPIDIDFAEYLAFDRWRFSWCWRPQQGAQPPTQCFSLCHE